MFHPNSFILKLENLFIYLRDLQLRLNDFFKNQFTVYRNILHDLMNWPDS